MFRPLGRVNGKMTRFPVQNEILLQNLKQMNEQTMRQKSFTKHVCYKYPGKICLHFRSNFKLYAAHIV